MLGKPYLKLVKRLKKNIREIDRFTMTCLKIENFRKQFREPNLSTFNLLVEWNIIIVIWNLFHIFF